MTKLRDGPFPADPPTHAVALPGTPTAARTARQATRTACQRWGLLPELVDTAELLTSEVVTNAIRHARPPVTLTLARVGARLRVEVTDASPDPPRTDIQPQRDQPGHHGLQILTTLATRWGHHRTGTGKMVWFELSTS